MDRLPPDAEKVASLRAALPAIGAGIYLDTATAGPLPAETAAAMREADEWDLRLGRAAAGRDEDAAQRAAEARAVIAALVTADADEIALTPGTGLALASAAWATELRPGDEVIAGSLDGPEVHAVATGLAERTGAELRVVQPPEAADGAAVADMLVAHLSSRTRLVLASLVSPLTGVRVAVPRIAEAAHSHEAWLVVDASQAVGAVPLAAGELGADFVAFATDTWALGPEGTAALWVAPRARAQARPAFAGRSAFDAVAPGGAAAPWSDARRFEPAQLPRTTLLGLARSVGWLAMYVGLEWAHERAVRLAGLLRRRLAELPGVEMLTPEASMATIVTYRVRGWPSDEAADELGRRVFAIHRPLPEIDALRASVSWFNTEEELERYAAAVAQLARHTPTSLPRRPSLVVLPAVAPTDEK